MAAAKRVCIRSATKQCILVLCEEIGDIIEREQNRKKRIWARKWISHRSSRGFSSMLLQELGNEDLEEYRNCMRMSKQNFDKLLGRISPFITKHDTLMRDAIPAKIKLEITLSYLATGNSFRCLQRQFRVSRPAISKFIPEVCDAIYAALQEYIKVPASHAQWKLIENGFRQRWNFPRCYGALDGKHFNIHAPANCGSEYFNYKGVNSIIMLAVVDYNYCFTYINVGCNGRQSDGGVFQNSSLYEALENDLLPPDGFLVGDDAFPLKKYLLKPYSRSALTKEQKIFNYRLSRARRIVENAFGILVSRFRVFEKPIACLPSTVDKIIKTCCALHNWLKITSTNNYMPRGSIDEEDIDNSTIISGSWRNEGTIIPRSISRSTSNHASRYAQQIRDTLCEYFMGTGSVPWQDRMIY